MARTSKRHSRAEIRTAFCALLPKLWSCCAQRCRDFAYGLSSARVRRPLEMRPADVCLALYDWAGDQEGQCPLAAGKRYRIVQDPQALLAAGWIVLAPQPPEGQAQARPKARLLEIWKSGTWKSGNVGSKRIKK